MGTDIHIPSERDFNFRAFWWALVDVAMLRKPRYWQYKHQLWNPEKVETFDFETSQPKSLWA